MLLLHLTKIIKSASGINNMGNVSNVSNFSNGSNVSTIVHKMSLSLLPGGDNSNTGNKKWKRKRQL